jgi:hypothetical protein
MEPANKYLGPKGIRVLRLEQNHIARISSNKDDENEEIVPSTTYLPQPTGSDMQTITE